MDGRNLDKSRY